MSGQKAQGNYSNSGPALLKAQAFLLFFAPAKVFLFAILQPEGISFLWGLVKIFISRARFRHIAACLFICLLFSPYDRQAADRVYPRSALIGKILLFCRVLPSKMPVSAKFSMEKI